jgi:hypothetical protein
LGILDVVSLWHRSRPRRCVAGLETVREDVRHPSQLIGAQEEVSRINNATLINIHHVAGSWTLRHHYRVETGEEKEYIVYIHIVIAVKVAGFTGIANPITVCAFLPWVGSIGTVVLVIGDAVAIGVAGRMGK